MKNTFLVITLLLFCQLSVAQLNMTLLSHLQYDEDLSDVWGWVAPDGTEYALVGVNNGVSIVSLADPSRATEVAFVPGQRSRWRDIKTWGNFAYVVADESGTTDGLVVIDLSNLPNTVSFTHWKPQIDGLGTLEKCHNLYIDDLGNCYLAGCNLNNGGVLYVDVRSNPGNPIYSGRSINTYAHDVVVKNNIMYASEIRNDRLAIYDITDKEEPILLGAQVTPAQFTHNAWPSDDGKYVFTTDEIRKAPVTAYDISDMDDIEELDQFRPTATLGTNVLPHNVHVWKNWLAISYYTDGGIIVDATRPDNLVEVGNFDTFPEEFKVNHGAWGMYPYFDSNRALLTDITKGLFVVQVDYQRACYLEGKVTDSSTGQQLNGVKVEILSSLPNVEFSNPAGDYKTGQEKAGRFSVGFFKEGYKRKIVEAELEKGEVTILNVKLEQEQVFRIGGRTININNGLAAPNADIRISNSFYSYQIFSDENGQFSLNEIYEGKYNIEVGAWGFESKLFENVLIDDFVGLSLGLEKGSYKDDFYFDLSWTAIADSLAQRGFWQLGEPIGTTFSGVRANPQFDIEDDQGDRCYVTGNHGIDTEFSDLDGGAVTLISPLMDLTTFTDPVLSYYYWFYNGSNNGTSLNSKFEAYLSNGNDTILLESINESQSFWRQSEHSLNDLLPLTNNMTVFFVTTDQDNVAHILEAGADGFLLRDAAVVSDVEGELVNASVKAFPNPFQDQFIIDYKIIQSFQNAQLVLFNTLGQKIEAQRIQEKFGQVSLGRGLPSGIYFVQLLAEGKPLEVIRVVKE